MARVCRGDELLVALAALAIEPALRAHWLPTRWLWIVALAGERLLKQRLDAALETHFNAHPRPTEVSTAYVVFDAAGRTRDVVVTNGRANALTADSVRVHVPGGATAHFEKVGWMEGEAFGLPRGSHVTYAIEMHPDSVRARGLPPRRVIRVEP